MKKLTNDMPSASLVEAYLTEIAKGYGVQWQRAGGDQSDEVERPVVSGCLSFPCGRRVG
jgi:hypothetical protein